MQEAFPDRSKNNYIEKCYNYYVSQRNSSFHFGYVLSENFDNTRGINTKEEADEIIKRCIDLNNRGFMSLVTGNNFAVSKGNKNNEKRQGIAVE